MRLRLARLWCSIGGHKWSPPVQRLRKNPWRCCIYCGQPQMFTLAGHWKNIPQ